MMDNRELFTYNNCNFYSIISILKMSKTEAKYKYYGKYLE